jgi:hypothetical protein
MTALPPEQSALDRKIVDELFEIVPEDWTAFVMTVEPRADLDGGGQAISILHPEEAGAEVAPTAPIREAVAGLAAFFAREGRTWERLTYTAQADEAGTWRLKISAPLPPPDAPTAA